LDCKQNQLISLDIISNKNLINLNCSLNQLLDLNTSKNPRLVYIDCAYNKIATMDITSNKLTYQLYLNGMPSLTKVCVWLTPFPPLGVYIEYTGSPNVYFTTDCTK
jgi:Leucine-rich repeat (LRR) protein